MSEGPASLPPGLPPALVAYRRTAEFNAATIPDALTRRHNTKKGVWAVISVLQGELRYRELDAGRETILTPQRPGLVVPQAWHSVEPLGPVRFFVQFYAAPSADGPVPGRDQN